MANLNFGQDVAKKRESSYSGYILYPIYPIASCMSRYGSLINIYPSAL